MLYPGIPPLTYASQTWVQNPRLNTRKQAAGTDYWRRRLRVTWLERFGIKRSDKKWAPGEDSKRNTEVVWALLENANDPRTQLTTLI